MLYQNGHALYSRRYVSFVMCYIPQKATAGGLLRSCHSCALLAAQNGLQPFCSKHSVVAGRAADSRSLHSLHSVAGRSEQ